VVAFFVAVDLAAAVRFVEAGLAAVLVRAAVVPAFAAEPLAVERFAVEPLLAADVLAVEPLLAVVADADVERVPVERVLVPAVRRVAVVRAAPLDRALARASAAGVRPSGRTVAPVSGPDAVSTPVTVGAVEVVAATVRRDVRLPVVRRFTGPSVPASVTSAMVVPPCGQCLASPGGDRSRRRRLGAGAQLSSPVQRASSASHASLRSRTRSRARSASAAVS
jgi:hypothetical protein